MNRGVLLWGAGVCAGVLPACAIALAWNQARLDRHVVTDRIVRITGAYRPPTARSDGEGLIRGVVGLLPIVRIETVFGFVRARRQQYPVSLPRVLAIVALISSLISLICLQLLGPAGLLSQPILWIWLTRLFYRWCDARRTATLFRQFPDALGMIVRAVRVGVPLGRAVSLVAEDCENPTAAEFRQLSEEVAIGLPLADALRAMGARNQLTEYRFFATALALQSQTGGGLAETLETLADTIRKRVAVKMRGHALASEARASCYVLAALPFVVGTLIYVVNPAYISVLFTTPPGLKLLGLAAISFSVGLYLMYQITNRSLG